MSRHESKVLNNLIKLFSSITPKDSEAIDKESGAVHNLTKKYYPMDHYEGLFIKDIKIEDKNEFLSEIKKIFKELSLSMETIEIIFREYFDVIKNSNNEFINLQKSEVINKLGSNSILYHKITNLYFNIINSIKNNNSQKSNTEDNMIIDDEDVNKVKKDEEENWNLKGGKKKKINDLSENLCKIIDKHKEDKKGVDDSSNDNNLHLQLSKDKKLSSEENLYLKNYLNAYIRDKIY